MCLQELVLRLWWSLLLIQFAFSLLSFTVLALGLEIEEAKSLKSRKIVSSKQEGTPLGYRGVNRIWLFQEIQLTMNIAWIKKLILENQSYENERCSSCIASLSSVCH